MTLKPKIEKVSLLFSILVFVRTAIYHLVEDFGGQMFISRSGEVQIQLAI